MTSTVSTMHKHPASPRRVWPLLATAFPLFLILIGLGTWQVQRLHWKEALLATIDQRIHEPPVDLSTLLAVGKPIDEEEYRPVVVSGTFDHAAERHFLATHDGESGFFVYTPLRLNDASYLFVNRGFVPYDRKDPATRPEGEIKGPVTITGLVRAPLSEKPSSLVPDNDPAKNVFYWKDLRAMTVTAGLQAGATVLPFFVDAGGAPNPGGLPVGGVTIIDLPNNHLQYAATWYGLATALAVIVVLMTRRARGNGPKEA